MKSLYCGVFGYCEENNVYFEKGDVESDYFRNVIIDNVFCNSDYEVKKVDIKEGLELFKSFMLWDDEDINESVEFGLLMNEVNKGNGIVLYVYDKVNLECGLIVVS